jgi:hypothetical protein
MRWPSYCPHLNHVKLAPATGREFLLWCLDRYPDIQFHYSDVEIDRVESGGLAGKLVASIVIYLPVPSPSLRELWDEFQRGNRPKSPEPTITKD